MLSIYNYNDFHTFLRDSLKAKKRKNPSFSLSAWAKQLGFENSSPLSLTLKGKRSLPKKYLPDVVSSLGLTSEEGLYLEALIDLSKAKTPEQKLFYMRRLEELSPVENFENNTVEEYKYLSDPLHTVLLEMTDLKDFRLDPSWIKDKLNFKTSIEEIQDAIDRLTHLGLLTSSKAPRWIKKTHKNLTTENDVADLGTKNYHKHISLLAADQVFRQKLSEREFGSYSFNVREQDLALAKKLIREFLQDFFKQVEAPPEKGEQTYQFNVQLFKMTK